MCICLLSTFSPRFYASGPCAKNDSATPNGFVREDNGTIFTIFRLNGFNSYFPDNEAWLRYGARPPTLGSFWHAYRIVNNLNQKFVEKSNRLVPYPSHPTRGKTLLYIPAGVTPFRDAQVSRTSGALSESPGLQHAATMAEANSADVNAALYGRIVGWKGSLEILCKEGMAGFRVPQAARTVLAGMMRPRATDRVSIEQALQLPWLMEAAAGQEDGVL